MSSSSSQKRLSRRADMEDLSRPIPLRNMGPPRDAASIIKSITIPALRSQASSFFGCFRYRKHGKECTSCRWYQLNVLHCLDSWEDVCYCCNCKGVQEDGHMCDDYPDDYENDDDCNVSCGE